VFVSSTLPGLPAGVSGILSAFTVDCFLRHVSAQTDRQTIQVWRKPERIPEHRYGMWHTTVGSLAQFTLYTALYTLVPASFLSLPALGIYGSSQVN
jgi:hypothetical protein